ncbi:pentatricopeptide repeat (PPR) superfamily protein [Actinidia rufa]|uniref:Pentatricopeptide repeat (PPR) superfamily protein n=1 Tax=Actinidia rufa TaxID=165716 RepID=A0A7J0EPR4_9ERIC|nr:pentatricopeptide repeat (PPR) superfamily protein [Actinidia rufa]
MHHQITKLVVDGLYKEALFLFTKHHSASFGPNKFTFPYLLKACGRLKAPAQAQMLHTHLIKTGYAADTYASTALTDVYMKLHLLDFALKVFDEIPDPNMASFNAVISGLSKNGYFCEALGVFRKVGLGKLRPNSVTLASLLASCERLADGIQVHCWAVKLGVESEVFVGTLLMSLYSGCAELGSAIKLFEMISDRSVVSYNAYITGLLQNGAPRAVLDVFKDMKGCSGEVPNSVTLVSVISACSSLLYLQFGRQVHGLARKTDMSFDTMVGTALVDMYSKCSRWDWAYAVFQELNGNRNLITWNSMIAGMMLNGQAENAIELFARLESEGLKPDSATWNSMICGFARLGKEVEAFMFFKKMQSAGVIPSLKSVTSLLPACSALCALQCGKEIHGNTIRTAICEDEFICTALIDMYMKCGLSSSAQRTFDLFEEKNHDPAIWNTMISGYGKNGEIESGFFIFDQMVEQKVKPNKATFNCVLSMCSHNGQVEKGWEIFRRMTRDYGLSPTPEHINCIVDLLGRSGWLNEARELLQEMPKPPSLVFASIINASIYHSDFKLGEEMAKILSELEPENPTPFVVLSNIYARQGRWRDAEMVRKTLDDKGLRKIPGLSSIEMA